MTDEQPPRRRIGLFGGTFDPPHIGHLVAAIHVRHVLELDQIWFVVANDPWQKEGTRPITPAADRLALVEAAVADEPGIVASDVEIRAGGPSYTIDTVTRLRETHPDTDWSVVLGADTASLLDTWHRAEELRAMIEVVVVNRPGGWAQPPQGWRVEHVTIPAVDVSSSELRSWMAEGRPIRYLVTPSVERMLLDRGAYRSPS